MATDWEEVKKLAFDFQRTQQMSSVQKLSERNCIDIVKRLIETKLVDVIFTNDGKEYITSNHLVREIENELYAAGGRIAISDLVAILNVDYSHIESKANQLARNSVGEISIVLEQLISREYKNNLTTEIDLHLQEMGSLAIADLSKQYDLPAEFLMNLLEERLGLLIQAKLDKEARILFTHDYIARYESKIVGIFSAITKPVILQTIVNRYSISEKILTATLEELLHRKRIVGSISGQTYIPEIYSKSQQEYVTNFYKHNRYLDYSTLSKLGISNPQSFLQKKFGNEMCYLVSCSVDRLLCFQVETTIEDCIQNQTFVDLADIMPSVLNPTDIDMLIKKALEQNRIFAQESVILCDTIVVSKPFLSKVKDCFRDVMHQKALADLQNGVLLSYFAKVKNPTKSDLAATEDDRKSKDVESTQQHNKKGKKGGGGGGGGNTQGREIKTKAVKKKYKAGGKGDKTAEESSLKVTLAFLSQDELVHQLTEKRNQLPSSEDISDELIEALAEHIVDELQHNYENYAKQLFVSQNAEQNKSRKTFGEVQRIVNDLYSQIVLFEKGIQIFTSEDFKSKLSKYLQRTLCTELLNHLLTYFIEEDANSVVTQEARLKLIAKLDEQEHKQIKESLLKINNSLSANSVDTFLEELTQVAPKMDLLLKKVDKKREKLLLSEHRHLLISQLSECTDPILALHISVLLLFQVTHDSMLHASGKFVPQILSFIEKSLDATLSSDLRISQDLVLQFVSAKDETVKNELLVQLNEKLSTYKPIVITYKKNSISSSEK